ncbi:MAG TPA: KGG domain-containing protein [Phycisphaerae bacterium]|nr:KGG domain-containing protein [Phycisphaerae bacterium]
MDSAQRPTGRSLRGFASMDKEKQRAIASKGGRAAHEKGTAHEFNSLEASLAAKKGHERGTAHEFTSEEARIAGRKGGLARAMNRAKSIDRSVQASSQGNGEGGLTNEQSQPMEAAVVQLPVEPASEISDMTLVGVHNAA